MTFLKRSIGVLNLQHDKKEVMDIDECDVEEFNKLLEAKDMRNDEVPTRIEECVFDQTNDAIDNSDDVLLVESGRALRPARSRIVAGITPTEVDKDFSLEYTYTSDVSS